MNCPTNTVRLFSIVLLAALTGCGDEDAATTDDNDVQVAETDSEDGDLDVSDTSPDLSPDVEIDVETAEETSETVEETTDTTDSTNEDVVDVEVDEIMEEISPDAEIEEEIDTTPEDVLVACEDSLGCEEPMACINETCRWPMTGVWADKEIRFEEPEELTNIFSILLGLASGVRFVTFSAEPSLIEGEVTAEFGAATILNQAADPIEVFLQDPAEGISVATFTPVVADPWAWISAPFPYNLSAQVRIALPGGSPIDAQFGVRLEDVIASCTYSDGDLPCTMAGTLTRAEAEDRVIGTTEEFTFGALFCTVSGYAPDDGYWNLSDFLDCNSAALDVDTNTDGILDAYRFVVTTVMVPAVYVD